MSLKQLFTLSPIWLLLPACAGMEEVSELHQSPADGAPVAETPPQEGGQHGNADITVSDDATETESTEHTETTDPTEDGEGTGSTENEQTGEEEETAAEEAVETCAAETYAAEKRRIDIYTLLDSSGSMSRDGKWHAVRSAIQEFVARPAEGQVGLGLGFFPLSYLDQCQTDDDCVGYGQCLDAAPHVPGHCELAPASCSTDRYDDPAVSIQSLEVSAKLVSGAIEHQVVDGDTPMYPALAGALSYARAHREAYPDRITAVLLASDGLPDSECDNDIDTVASAAAAGLENGIHTFVVGIGDLPAFEKIADAGGTSPALIIGETANLARALHAKLEEIRGMVDCQFQIPFPESGTPDYEHLNVLFTPKGNGDLTDPISFPRVPDASGCRLDPGYYYDDLDRPTTILLCPTACQALEDQRGNVEIALGCEPVKREPEPEEPPEPPEPTEPEPGPPR